MIVRSYDDYEAVGDFDPISGRLVQLGRGEVLGDAGAEPPLCGHFADLDGTVAVLYRYTDGTWLRLGDEARKLSGAGASVRRELDGRYVHLVLFDGFEVVASARYRPGPQTGPPLAADPTPFVEDEDWDFGLFVENVIRDKSRMARLYPKCP